VIFRDFLFDCCWFFVFLDELVDLIDDRLDHSRWSSVKESPEKSLWMKNQK
jgi:hypothetical protein